LWAIGRSARTAEIGARYDRNTINATSSSLGLFESPCQRVAKTDRGLSPDGKWVAA
jgi:hypothetical protein